MALNDQAQLIQYLAGDASESGSADEDILIHDEPPISFAKSGGGGVILAITL